MDKLAFYGGEPVRKKPFPSNYLGVTFYGEEELKELTDVIKTKSPFRHYGLGNPQKVATFESEARKYFGSKFALALSSGSAALFCATVALGIGPGDEVILPAFGWFSDYYAITNTGALPVFADVDETLNIDPTDLKEKITSKTKAVIVINFQGCPAKMDEIVEIIKKHNIKIVEDIAQAFGGSYRGTKLGTMGDIAIASFQQNKMISCGEGGLLLTDNEEYFIKAVRYHDLGFARPIFIEQIENRDLAKPENTFAGMQFRMSELQGAVMIAQLNKLDQILNICRKHHAKIRDYFRENRSFKIRYIEGDCGITLFLLFNKKEEATEFGKYLSAEGVTLGATSACKNLIPVEPIKSKRMLNDSMPPFGKGFEGEHIEYNSQTLCPNTDKFVERYVAMGIGPQYTDTDIEDLIRAIEKVDRNIFANTK